MAPTHGAEAAVGSCWPLGHQGHRRADLEHVVGWFAAPDQTDAGHGEPHGLPGGLEFGDQPQHFRLALDLPDAQVRLESSRPATSAADARCRPCVSRQVSVVPIVVQRVRMIGREVPVDVCEYQREYQSLSRVGTS